MKSKIAPIGSLFHFELMLHVAAT